jgi:hypothetical protein
MLRSSASGSGNKSSSGGSRNGRAAYVKKSVSDSLAEVPFLTGGWGPRCPSSRVFFGRGASLHGCRGASLHFTGAEGRNAARVGVRLGEQTCVERALTCV